jgi:hypothetical protein
LWGEQVRKQPHHDFAVFQHVRHARRRARIVLQHVELLVVDADDVDAGDVHINVVRHVLAVHLGPEHRVLVDQVLRDQACAQDIAGVVDVRKKHVQRFHALLQPGFEDRPFLRGNDPWNDVEWDQPLLRLGVAVDGEGDADPAEQQFGFLAPIFQRVRRRLLQPERQLPVGLTQAPVRLAHFIERNCHGLPKIPPGALRLGQRPWAWTAPKQW